MMETITSCVSGGYNWLWSAAGYTASAGSEKMSATEVARYVDKVFWRCNWVGSPLIRVVGLSGAMAVGLGAYGAHAFREDPEKSADMKRIFETAQRYHMIHTLALLAVPLCRRPRVTGLLLGCGMVMFSGSCYYHALSGDARFRAVTPYGGLMLIAGWLSMML